MKDKVKQTIKAIKSATNTPVGDSFTFAVKGDWGSGKKAQSDLTARMCEVRKTRPFSVVVTTGDNFYNPDGNATPSNYEEPERCLLNYPGFQWKAAWGNHDVRGRSTAEKLGSTSRYFAWSQGKIEFFFLDSNEPENEVQFDWLKSSLSASKASTKIVVFHHSPYTVGLHENNRGVQVFWVPLFERYSVDLVLSGHNHGYEHSVVNGIEYVVSGGGGAALYPCVHSATWSVRCTAKHHFLVIQVSDEMLVVDAIDELGNSIDHFVIKKS